MPVKRLKTTTMKKNKKTKTKKQTNKKTNKQKKNKSIINTSTDASTIIHSNMDTMYNNNNNANSNIDSNILSSNTQMQNHTMNQQKLVDLITKISQERKNKTKSQTNLVAKIMRIPSMSSSMSKMTKPKTYAKSVSSYYSTMTHNGESHNKGKKVVNESTKPYLEIDELKDGQVQHYMLPKNSIHYRERIEEVVPIKEPKIVLEYFPQSNKNKKYKKKTKTTKTTKKTKKN